MAMPPCPLDCRRTVACSTYFADVLARYPEALEELHSAGRLDRPLATGELDRRFCPYRPNARPRVTACANCADCAIASCCALAGAICRAWPRWQKPWLNYPRWRTRQFVRRCAGRLAGLVASHGQPRAADGRPVDLAVLGMGKLGGRELNFSSDVDLIFVYTDQGETDGQRPVSNERYFRLLAQRLINLLSKQTADGFVYRVDARLRPFGDSGPLAVSLPALESYLLTHGRDWERYAYVKARVINAWDGTEDLQEQVLRPFVYRRYLDFGVFASLRDMKAMIEAEGRRKEYSRNLKLGPGGIREIEFIVQSLQLVRGGPVAELRERELQQVLPRLVRHQCLPGEVAEELLQAYHFLRVTENRLQAMADRQTHDLPEDELERERLALAMNAASWDELAAQCDAQREIVARHFRDIVFRDGEDQSADPETAALRPVWAGELPEETAVAVLENAGFADGAAAYRQVSALREGGAYRRMDESGRQRLDGLLPKLLKETGRQSDPDRALAGTLRVVEAIGRRSAYFALLNENPASLARLARLCSLGDFLVARLAAHPLLLDELLDQRVFAEPPGRDELAEDLALRLAAAGEEDAERRHFALVNFQQAATFRVAVADLSGALPLMKVSDRLTDIAELVLDAALQMAWAELTARHGVPRCRDGGVAREAHFAIVAYGKLGGLELGYGSDLDLVFLHDSTGEAEETDGEKPLANAVFFARLVQRIISVLTLATTSGELYEVDTRLRPSGRSGMLVSSLKAFDRYQREDAWTWEHQALLRSRSVAGDAGVCAAFEELRRASLLNYVKRDTLKEEVSKMRARMREENSKGTADDFDLKQDRGGIADIEFLVQYLVLNNAVEYPDLLEYSDNIRQLEALARNGLITGDEEKLLADTYRDYRTRLHRQALAGAPGLAPRAEMAARAGEVVTLWQRSLD